MKRSFLLQVPLVVLSIGLVWWRLENPKIDDAPETQSTGSKWKRIDFAGALFMALTILPIMLAFDMGAKETSWGSPLLLGLYAASLVSGVLFCLTEKYFAKEPIFPLELLRHYVVVTSYLQTAIQIAIQTAVRIPVPELCALPKYSFACS